MLKKIISFLSKYFYISIYVLFLSLVMGAAVRGNLGNPNEIQLNDKYWKEEGPFELSPERGRFILAYSLVENKSFQFSENLAHFGSPDVAVTKDGKFASLFAPALSFLIIQGYLTGKLFNASQVGAFFVISLFAILNTLLIRKISISLGAGKIASTIASLTFLFATPAFAYGVNLYQHHISTFLILLSIYFLINFKGFISLFFIFLFLSFGVTLDYPNFFMMFPIGLVALRKIISFEKIRSNLKIRVRNIYLFSAGALTIPILFLLWFNLMSFDNPFQLSGTLKTVRDFDQTSLYNPTIQGIQPNLEQKFGSRKTAIGFFSTRNLTNGFYLHFLSPDRGILYFTPVLFFSIIGAAIAYKKRLILCQTLIAIIGISVLLYSMWADPWGGWAFGSRYLIPSYAIAAIFIAIFLSSLSRNWKSFLGLILFFILFCYSVFVNTLGAITSSANPPQVEVLSIEKLSGKEEKYTFLRNWQYLLAGNSKSFVFRSYAQNYMNSLQFFYILMIVILAGSTILFLYMIINISRKRYLNTK